MQDEKKYNDSIHFIGRVGSIIAVAFMVGIPVVVCAVYKCFPDIKTVAGAAGTLLAIFGSDSFVRSYFLRTYLGLRFIHNIYHR